MILPFEVYRAVFGFVLTNILEDYLSYTFLEKPYRLIFEKALWKKVYVERKYVTGSNADSGKYGQAGS